jgi:hypothetical protein
MGLGGSVVSLSFRYEIKAPATTSPELLQLFLSRIERNVKELGFDDTFILNGPFDTADKQALSQRIGARYYLENENLKGLALPADGQIFHHDLVSGLGRLIPIYGVLLLAAEKQGVEFCLGFLQFPKEIRDIHGKLIVRTGLNYWHFKGFVNSPDVRDRQLIEIFNRAGYLESAFDEYAV